MAQRSTCGSLNPLPPRGGRLGEIMRAAGEAGLNPLPPRGGRRGLPHLRPLHGA